MASHELMHFRDFVKNLSSTFYAKEGGPWFKPANPDEMRADTTIRSWLAELLADLLAVRRFGIAYFLAFAEWSLTHDLLDRYSESHPSSRYRLQFMLEELSDLGYDGGLTDSALTQEFDVWRTELATSVDAPSRMHQIASGALLQAKGALQRFARDEMKGHEYPASKFRDVTEPLVEGIMNGIPPAQFIERAGENKMVTADFPSILNAGWVTYVARMDRFSELTNRADQAEGLDSALKLSGLIAKALELVEIAGDWEEAASKL